MWIVMKGCMCNQRPRGCIVTAFLGLKVSVVDELMITVRF